MPLEAGQNVGCITRVVWVLGTKLRLQVGNVEVGSITLLQNAKGHVGEALHTMQ